ncbi:MAG: multicopper oxidase domain-containing protein [Solirubrobacteraceae bacterium]
MTGPIGRRQFVASAGGTLFCTLAGQKLTSNSHVNLQQLSGGVPVPPKVAAYYHAQAQAEAGAAARPEFVSDTRPRAASASGAVHTYWIKAVKTKWNIVPTHHDGMMDRRVPGRTTFTALAYQPWTPGFAKPLGPPQIPGPLLEAQTGDTIVVNFRNQTGVPVTMHPHGIFYTHDMDGAYKGKYTEPGGFVENGRTFQYVWEARPGTEGAWLYHDHGPMDPLPVFKGMFGGLIIRKPSDPVPNQEFFVFLHSFAPLATGLEQQFSCINGRAYAGNTPTLHATVGDTVNWHVFAIDNDFHAFHLHGHRWIDPDGGVLIDNHTLGPADVTSFSIVEDNPGRWFYHCHVFSHLHMGMNGWYVVSP